MKTPTSALTVPATFAALILAALALGTIASAQDLLLPGPQAGAADIHIPTDAGNDVHLKLDPQYTTQDFGRQLSTEQIEKLDTIRSEAPSKYQILSALFPEQIAEFLMRTPSTAGPAAPADDPVARMVWQIASDYISQPESGGFTDSQLQARADFIHASLQTLPPQPPAIQHILEQASQVQDRDFDSPEKTLIFNGLKNWYSPYRQVSMSIIGDTLRIDDRIVTNHLSDAAAAADLSPEQYAYTYYARYNKALADWRSAQLSGNAYAGTIRRFLNDPRLSDFSPEEIARAYQRVFGRDLKTDLQADALSARLGHPITYNDLRAQSQKD
jgi:hypothetical protein